MCFILLASHNTLQESDIEPLGCSIYEGRDFLGSAVSLSEDGCVLAISAQGVNNGNKSDAGEVAIYEIVSKKDCKCDLLHKKSAVRMDLTLTPNSP